MPLVSLPSAPAAEELRDDEIHVWRLDYRRAAGRAPLRQILARYLACTADEVQLLEDEHGRPQLGAHHPHAALGFNWSHSGACALLAVARNLRPGIDLERVRERPNALAIAERYFCTEEAAALAALPEAQRSDTFLRLWTAKEAVLKAHGRGLAFGLDRIKIDIAQAQLRLRHFEGDDPAAWQLQPLTIDPMHVAAIAWRGTRRRLRRRSLADAD